MSWTETAGREHDRRRLRYATDCTDKEWAFVRLSARRTFSEDARTSKRPAPVGRDPVYRIGGVAMGASAKGPDAHHHGAAQFYDMRDSGVFDVHQRGPRSIVRVSEGRTPAPRAVVIDNRLVKDHRGGRVSAISMCKKPIG